MIDNNDLLEFEKEWIGFSKHLITKHNMSISQVSAIKPFVQMGFELATIRIKMIEKQMLQDFPRTIGGMQ